MNQTMLQSAKQIGAGLATIGLAGVGAGIGIVCKSKNMINNKIPTITESEKLQKTAKNFKIQICSETSERWKQ